MPRPAYRRGRGLRQHSFRMSDEVIALLRAEAERRHVWMSALVEHVLLQALRPAAGAGDVAVQAAASGNRSSPRHWCRIAIDTPVWEGLLREANRRGMSIPQLIRQHLGGFGRAEFPVSDGAASAGVCPVGPNIRRAPMAPVVADPPRVEDGHSRSEPTPADTALPTRPLPIFELT